MPGQERDIKSYQPQLDSLRTMAVSLVLIQHSMPLAKIPVLHSIGATGVAAFFVLSGFLISGILLSARDAVQRGQGRAVEALKSFYARRSLRIFPLYFAVLALVVIAGTNGVRGYWPWHALYLSNYLSAAAGHYVYPTHFWSLSVEEQFYLLWAPIVLFFPRKWLLPVAAAMIAIGPVSRILLYAWRHSMVTAFTPTMACLDLLGLGCVLALWTAETGTVQGRAMPTRLAVLGLALGAVEAILEIAGSAVWVRVFLNTLPWALVACWLTDRAAAGFTGPIGRLLEWKPLVYLGKISYGIYIYHVFVPLVVPWILGPSLGAFFPARGLARLAVVSLLTVAVASASWAFFEGPLNRQKDRFRFPPSDQRSVPAR